MSGHSSPPPLGFVSIIKSRLYVPPLHTDVHEEVWHALQAPQWYTQFTAGGSGNGGGGGDGLGGGGIGDSGGPASRSIMLHVEIWADSGGCPGSRIKGHSSSSPFEFPLMPEFEFCPYEQNNWGARS